LSSGGPTGSKNRPLLIVRKRSFGLRPPAQLLEPLLEKVDMQSQMIELAGIGERHRDSCDFAL
jgi:hypothetical protein